MCHEMTFGVNWLYTHKTSSIKIPHILQNATVTKEVDEILEGLISVRMCASLWSYED